MNDPKPDMNSEDKNSVVLTPAGLARRIKRHLIKTVREYLAITTPGFEPVLEREIRAFPDVTIKRAINGGVEFYGPLSSAYHANLKLRTANRVLMRIDTFIARSLPELYQKTKRVHWELFIGFEKEVAFEASSGSSRLHHTDNIIKGVFQGVADRMKGLGVTMAHNQDAPIKLFIRFSHDKCTVSIDSSGELLHKRGYRQEIGHAPLRETTAAGLLLHAGWDAYSVIADPLCGSGTFAVEAAMLVHRRAPGSSRSFSVFSWPSFNGPVFERIKREALAAECPEITVRLLASDISQKAIMAAKNNIDRAGFAKDIALRCGDCLDFNSDGSFGKEGLIISNLPYGKRAFAEDDPEVFYTNLGAHLKKTCSGWHYGFVLAERGLIKTLGLPVGAELRFENGGIPVTFVNGKIP
jgi:putative N6-adenine-specific DNA methylase